MKNLKRVLSLGLALVMLLGMLTVAGAADEAKKSAKDLSDYDSIANKEAVALLYDLGIINGMPDGSFTPAGNVDRSSWAKMVYYVKEGNADPSMYKGTANTLKDVAGWWAEGEIAYLYSAGIVAGDDTGNFNIRANIRVDEAAKTLLVTLGYDSKDRGYEGAAVWSANIMKDAKAKGLLAGIDQAANTPLTRDNAARMIFNALFAKVETATYGRDNGEKYVTGYKTETYTLGEAVYSLAKKTGLVNGLDKDGNATIDNVKAPANADVIGQTGVVYTWGTDGVSSFVITAGSSVIKSYLDGSMNWAKIINKDDKAFVALADDSVNLYVDGTSSAFNATGSLPWNVPGNEVLLLDNNANDKIDTIKVTTYSVEKVTGDTETRTLRDGTPQTRVPGVTGWVATSSITGAAGLKEGDVVLANADKSVLTKAEVVTGKVTRVSSSDAITVNGKAYTASGIKNTNLGLESGKTLKDWADRDNEYNFYLDRGGNICLATKVPGAAADSSLAIVLASAKVSGSQGLSATAGYWETELLYMDGSTEVVRVTSVGTEEDVDKITVSNLKGKFVDVKETDKDQWNLTERTDSTMTSTATELKNAIKFDGNNSANNATVFILGKADSKGKVESYTAYTGYANVPAVNGVANTKILLDKGGVATYVYATYTGFVGEAAEGYIYVQDKAAYEVDENGNYVLAIVTAEGDAADSDVALLTSAGFAKITANGFYSIKEENDGVINDVEAVSLSEDVVSIAGGVFKGSKTSVAYDSKTVCVYVDVDAEGAFVEAGTFSPETLDYDTNSETGTYTSVKVDFCGAKDGDVATYIYVLRTVA